jgi:hypothetical protein
MSNTNTQTSAARAAGQNVFGSTPVTQGHGEKPWRYVLRFLGAGSAMPYVTHLETLNEDGTHDGYHHGDYCSNMLEGYESLKRRAAEKGLRVLDANGKNIPLKQL